MFWNKFYIYFCLGDIFLNFNTTCCEIHNLPKNCMGNCEDNPNLGDIAYRFKSACDNYDDIIQKCKIGEKQGNYDTMQTYKINIISLKMPIL